MFGLNEFGLAIGLGVVLFALCCIALVVEALWDAIYGFINESETADNSKMVTKLATSMGYTERKTEGIWRFYDANGEMQSGIWPFMKHTLALSLSPILILLAFKMYAITLFLVSATALLFLARFAFRAKKLMSKHIENKDIHKD